MDSYEISGMMAVGLVIISVIVIPFISILLNIISKINKKISQTKITIETDDNTLREENIFMQNKGPIDYK